MKNLQDLVKTTMYGATLALGVVGCNPPPAALDNPIGTGGGTGGGTNVGDDSGSSTANGEVCFVHCFSGETVDFPYTTNPIDGQGNPLTEDPICETTMGGTIDYDASPITIPLAEACVPQDIAEEVYEVGICNAPGSVPQPESSEWTTWSSAYTARLRQNCVDELLDDGCVLDDANSAGGLGANQLCDWFLSHAYESDLLDDTPLFTHEDPTMVELQPGETCDYIDTLECISGTTTGTTGGGVQSEPYGDVSELLSCNAKPSHCFYEPELKDNILAHTDQFGIDGLNPDILGEDEDGYPGVKLNIPGSSTPTYELFDEIGVVDGDIIKTVEGVNLELCTDSTCFTLYDNYVEAYIKAVDAADINIKYVRNGKVTALEFEEK